MRRTLKTMLFVVACYLLMGAQFSFAGVVTPDGPWASSMVDERGSVVSPRPVSYVRFDWSTGGAETTAVDTKKTVTITGKIVGVQVYNGTVTTAYTLKILDSAGRDVLQGLFSDTEASASATVDAQYRVPVDDTHGAYIWLVNEAVYLSVSSAGNSNSGYVILIIQSP